MIFDSHGKGFLPKIRYDKEYARTHGAELYWVYLIIETPGYIIYTYEYNHTRNKILYDKSTNKKFKIGQQNLGEYFKNAHESNPEKKIALKKLADSLNDTDNPVLVVARLKK